MIVVLSPAKTLQMSPVSGFLHTQPASFAKVGAAQLLGEMKKKSAADLKKLQVNIKILLWH